MLAAAVLFGFVMLLTMETFRRSISVYGAYNDDPSLLDTSTANTDLGGGERGLSREQQQAPPPPPSQEEQDQYRAKALEILKLEHEEMALLPEDYHPYLPTTSATHINETTTTLDPNFQPPEDQLEITHIQTLGQRTQPLKLSYCVPWTTNSDEWWAHHPTWEQGLENQTHYCFNVITDTSLRQLYQQLYHIQFRTDCSNVHTKVSPTLPFHFYLVWKEKK